MTTRTASELLFDYGSEFNSIFATRHSVTSPLGLWALLALVAPAATGADRDALEAALGTDANRAATIAGDLLRHRHPAVRTAAALWCRPEWLEPRAWGDFTARLPQAIETGPVPDQDGADHWAREQTLGMIEHFPLAVTPDTALVMASAFAADVSWAVPFRAVPAVELGGAIGAAATTALQAPPEHPALLARTVHAGIVGVHVADSDDDLRVLSVIADHDVAPARVHAAAAEVAALLAGSPSTASGLSLFDVPLGPGPAWTITETEGYALDAKDGKAETIQAILPEWRADSVGDQAHDLLAGSAPGVHPALATLQTLIAPERRPMMAGAKQAAVASYTRTGFRAAAVTAIGLARSAPLGQRVRFRQACVRFNHPYAVVAVTVGDRGGSGPAWANLPVFCAWVEHAVEHSRTS